MRRARASDRDAVLRFASATWDGWDYIPDVWNDWLESAEGIALVALSAEDGSGLNRDEPIAFCRVAMLSADEAWLEGMRVDPAVRGRSVATNLQVAELAWARAQGATVVRYATGEDNEGSHRLGARHGFRRLRDWRSYGRRDEDELTGRGEDLGRLRGRLQDAGLVAARDAAPGVSARLWPLIESDRTFLAGDALYEWRPWALQRLDEQRLEAHAKRGEVLLEPETLRRLTVTTGNAAPGPWAATIVSLDQDAEHGPFHLAHLVGDPAAALSLGSAVVEAAGAPVHVRLPDAPPVFAGVESDAAARGFPPYRGALHIFQRPLAEGPLPEPDAPGLLEYDEMPSRVTVPASLEV